MAGRMISGAAALAELVRAAGEHEAPGVHRMLPVAPELSALLPGRGLRRGSTVAVATGRAASAGERGVPVSRRAASAAERAASAGERGVPVGERAAPAAGRVASAGERGVSPAGRVASAGERGASVDGRVASAAAGHVASAAGRVASAGGRGALAGGQVASAAGHVALVGGSTSLLLALLAEASRAGSWCAVVGLPSLGMLAAQENGIDLERLALVPDPGPDWPTVIAALIDGVDVVVAAVPGQVTPTVADRLVARARQRGSVLMPFGQWPGADVTLQVTASRWEGLSPGRGRLRRREVTILARGRGAAARPKEITLWMPGMTHHPPATTTHSPHTTTPAEAPPRSFRTVPSASGPSASGPSASGPFVSGPFVSGPSASGRSASGPSASGMAAPGLGLSEPGVSELAVSGSGVSESDASEFATSGLGVSGLAASELAASGLAASGLAASGLAASGLAASGLGVSELDASGPGVSESAGVIGRKRRAWLPELVAAG
jgi:hypothetical protein